MTVFPLTNIDDAAHRSGRRASRSERSLARMVVLFLAGMVSSLGLVRISSADALRADKGQMPGPSVLRFSKHPSDQEFARIRLLSEPLVPASGKVSTRENQELARALIAYSGRNRNDDTSAIEAFLRARPESRWSLSLLTGLGMAYRQTGYLSRAIPTLERAWAIGKDVKVPTARAIADRAFVELLEVKCGLGLVEEARPLVDGLGNRDLRGSAHAKLVRLEQALVGMEINPSETFRCGPLGILKLLSATKPRPEQVEKVMAARARAEGTSLADLHALANQVGLPMRMAFRPPNAAIVTPALMSLKVRHFVALIREEGGRYLIEDPSFNQSLVITREAIESEASGYFLIPDGPLPPGWHAVDDAEGMTVWGK